MTSELDEWLTLYKELAFKLYMAKSTYFGQKLSEFERSKGKVSNRTAKRVGKRLRPAFDAVADTFVEYQACRNTILEVCVERGLDWPTVCDPDPELKRYEQENEEYFEVTSDEELLELVDRWRPFHS